MRVFAISDLHITGADDPFYRAFVDFLGQLNSDDILVVDGDLFDLLVGNKKVFRGLYSDFFSAVEAACARGVRIHYIEGNHDFLLRDAFCGISGITVHRDCVAFEADGKKFYVAHGDTVDRGDYGYRFLRMLFRSHLMKCGVWLVPGSWLLWFGNFMSARSRLKRQRELSGVVPIDLAALRLKFRNFALERLVEGVDYVVLGHTHDADEMMFVIGDRKGYYFNGGYPRASRQLVVWKSGDEKPEFQDFFGENGIIEQRKQTKPGSPLP